MAINAVVTVPNTLEFRNAGHVLFGGLDQMTAFAQHRTVIHSSRAARGVRYDVVVVVVPGVVQRPSAFLATTSTSL